MTEYCRNCGRTVSDDYARVKGDRQGRVFSCPYCNGDGRDSRAVRGTLFSLKQRGE